MVTFDDGRAPEIVPTDSGGKFDVKNFGRSACSFQPMTLTHPPLALGGKFRLQLPLVKEETREVEAVVARQQFKLKDRPMSDCEATGVFTHADGTITRISGRLDAQGCLPLLLPHGCISEYRALTTVIADDGKTRIQVVVPASPFAVPARAPGSTPIQAQVSRGVAQNSSRIEFLNFCAGTNVVFLADVSGSMEGDKLVVLKRTLHKALDEVPNHRQTIALQAWNDGVNWFRSKLPASQSSAAFAGRLGSVSAASKIPEELCDTVLGRIGEMYRDPVMAADGYTYAVPMHSTSYVHYTRCRYERSAIEAWLASNGTSPKDKSPLANKQLIPNRDMYPPSTCQLTIRPHHDAPPLWHPTPPQAKARFCLP